MVAPWKNWLKKVPPSETSTVVQKCIDSLSRKNIGEMGVDPFGFDPNSLKYIFTLGSWLYKNYFRCETFGMENVPEGRILVVANHSGQLPFDGLMIETAFLLDSPKPRLLRGMAERWSAELPFVSTLFVRSGQVVGDPKVCKKLLEMDEAVVVFPEGVKGIAKLFHERYQLLTFGHGFMRLALETQTPIVPLVLIGAEEQAPAIANLTPLAKLLGMPAFPIVFPQILPFPLPVKYRIHIGEPMYFKGDGTEDDVLVTKYVYQTRQKLQSMIAKGLQERKSVFF